MSDTVTLRAMGSKTLKSFSVVLVVYLWLLPAWLIWQVTTQADLQRGLSDAQLGILSWYPLIAILMLFFAVVLYRRLPKTWLGMCGYLIGAVVMPGLHWWLSKVTSLTVLIAEWATFSLTLFVLGFSLELLRRMLVMARRGHWTLVIVGGLANLMLFVVPGILIAASLYLMLYQQGLFRGGLLLQIPYLVALSTAVWHDWRSFHAI